MTDSAFIARVSTVSLAGLGLASAVLTTVIGLSVFLAYSTTASVARAFGAGRRQEAIARGVDACWLALMSGVGAAALLAVGGRFLLSLFGPSAEVLDQATIYLMLSAAGVPAMRAVQAATGLSRALQDARLRLIAAVCAAGGSVALDWVLIFGRQLGIAGSAIGTAISRRGMAAVLLLLVARAARRHGAPLRPHLDQVASPGRESVPMS